MNWRFWEKNETVKLAVEDKTVQRSRNMIIDLVESTKNLTRQDLNKWRKAHQMALNYDNPKRINLYDIYDDIDIDNHLTGAIRNRKFQTLRRKFKLVDINSEAENTELTKLMQSKWFKKFMALALDSIFWGHSLIQFGDILSTDKGLKFSNVELVPRRHVVPEYGVIIKEISDDRKKGINYRKPPLSQWSIEVGEPKDLGLLLKACVQAIPKKNMFAFWDKFGELFGIPIRIGKTNSREPNERNKMEEMLANMGAAAWGLFAEGTEIEIKESSNKDSYMVYDKRIDRANSELSKLILGETMTMDNGSSRSQSEVHERVAEDVVESDSDMLKDIINDDLLPFLLMHGFPVQNLEFQWDDVYQYTATEQLEIEKWLSSIYEIDEQFFIDKYGVPITGVKQQSSVAPFSFDPLKKKLMFETVYNMALSEDDILYLSSDNSDMKSINENLLQQLWSNPGQSFYMPYYNFVTQILIDALQRGYNNDMPVKFDLKDLKITTGYDSKDTETLRLMQLNIFEFSAKKNYENLKDLNSILQQSKTYEDFKRDALPLLDTFNLSHLRTESVSYTHLTLPTIYSV